MPVTVNRNTSGGRTAWTIEADITNAKAQEFADAVVDSYGHTRLQGESDGQLVDRVLKQLQVNFFKSQMRRAREKAAIGGVEEPDIDD